MISQISKLHYITQDLPYKTHIELVQEACESGIDWVQLRIKNRSEDEIFSIAKKCKEICTNFSTKLIINDHVSIAKTLELDGVHLGLTDMSINHARNILGEHVIIGGTANTLEDIKLQKSRGANYIGLGPYKYTNTKKNLSPILGIKGYQNVCDAKLGIPIIAIGGIKAEDIKAILSSGVHGVAIASEISTSENMKRTIESICSELETLRK